MMHRAVALGACLLPRAVWGQPVAPSAQATPSWETTRYVRASQALTVTLGRTVAPAARIAWFVGAVDMSLLVRTDGERVHLRPGAFALPAGEHEVVLYEVSHDTAWREVARLPIKVLTSAGLVRSSVTPTLDLASAGQLDQGLPDGTPSTSRTRYQDATVSAGVRGRWEGPSSVMAGVARVIAASEPTQRLRWNSRQRQAPAADLADYQLEYLRGSSFVRAGHVQLGASRQLVNGFAARGVTSSIALGRGVSVSGGVSDGSSRVGWDHLLGVSRPEHRVATGAIDWSILPRSPGAIEVSAALLDASVLPIAGVTQGVVNDAERSRGHSVTVSLVHPSQRARLAAGFAESDFTNPTDPLLSGDGSVVPVRGERRRARYAETSLQLLSSARLLRVLPVSLGVSGRYERVDPLYRSIAAPLQADVDRRGMDLSLTLGTVQVQGTLASTRDNLGRLASVLTSRTRGSGLTVMVPGAAAFGAKTPLVPVVTGSIQRTHQYGEGVPVNSGFAASSVPDQESLSPTVAAAWQWRRWGITYRWNAASQDNRQAGRDRADFRSRVHSIGVQASTGDAVTLGLDASAERQRNLESGTVSRTRQLSSTVTWKALGHTTLQLSYAPFWSRDGLLVQRRRSSTGAFELSQGLTLYRRAAGESQGRAFLRYSWSAMRAGDLGAPTYGEPAEQWALSTGLSFRLY